MGTGESGAMCMSGSLRRGRGGTGTTRGEGGVQAGEGEDAGGRVAGLDVHTDAVGGEGAGLDQQPTPALAR